MLLCNIFKKTGFEFHKCIFWQFTDILFCIDNSFHEFTISENCTRNQWQGIFAVGGCAVFFWGQVKSKADRWVGIARQCLNLSSANQPTPFHLLGYVISGSQKCRFKWVPFLEFLKLGSYAIWRLKISVKIPTSSVHSILLKMN